MWKIRCLRLPDCDYFGQSETTVKLARILPPYLAFVSGLAVACCLASAIICSTLSLPS